MRKSVKISVMAVVITLMTVFSASAQRNIDVSEEPTMGRIIADKVLMYIPNRFMDLMDIFSLKIGTGVTSKAQLRLTHAFGIGYGIGPTGSVEWSYGRRLGTSLDQGKEIFFLGDGYYNIQREFATGTLEDYWYQSQGMQWPEDPVFSKDKAFDYWAIEVEVAAFADVKFALHPVEIADFIAGIFLVDCISKDDYTLIIP